MVVNLWQVDLQRPETPRHRPEFAEETDTYYQVMFESPDRILFEVVYTGPKS